MNPAGRHRFARTRATLDKTNTKFVASATGALSLMPANAHRLWRLGVLAGLAAERKPPEEAADVISREKLRELLDGGELGAEGSTQEDPFADVLTEEITFWAGSLLVGAGLAGEGVFTARLAIRSLLLTEILPSTRRAELTSTAQAVLRLSDHVLRASGLIRNQAPPAFQRGATQVPGQSALRRAQQRLVFSLDELNAIPGVDAEFLRPFMQRAGGQSFSDEQLTGGFAARWPMTEFGDRVVLARPFDLLLALRHHLFVEAVSEVGAVVAARAFGAAVDIEVMASLRRLGIHPDVTERSDDQPWTVMRADLDVDIELVCLVLADPLENLTDDPYQPYDERAHVTAGQRYWEAAADATDKQVLGLMIHQSAGRSVFLGTPSRTRDNLTMLAFDAADLEVFAALEDGGPVGLWKFARAQHQLEGARVVQFSALDLYSAYRSHDQYLGHLAAATMIMVPPGDAGPLRMEFKAARDRHGAFYPDGTMREVDRERDDGLGARLYSLVDPGGDVVVLVGGQTPLNVWVAGPKELPPDLGVLPVVLDTFAYWTAELLPELNVQLSQLADRIPCLMLRVDLADPAFWAATGEDPGGDTTADVVVTPLNAEVKLGPAIRRLAPAPDNAADRAIVATIVDALETLWVQYGVPPLVTAEKLRIRDVVAPAGAKKHLLMFPSFGNEVLARAERQPRHIQVADLSVARATIGAHVSEKFEVKDADVPPDDREPAVRSAVNFALANVEELIANSSPEGLLESLLAANEAVIAESEHNRAVLPARLATYPVAGSREYLRDEVAQSNRAAVCCRFLAELVAAQPPEGATPWSLARYDAAMALTSEMIGWAYLDDAFVYGMTDVSLLVNEHGELRLEEHDRYELGRVAYFDRHIVDMQTASENLFALRLSAPTERKPNAIFERVDPLFEAEAGASLSDLRELLHAASAYARDEAVDVVCLGRADAVEALSMMLEWDEAKTDQAITYLSLASRDEFLKPPDGDWRDVVPTRYARRWSLNRRPFVVRRDELLWGQRQVLIALRVIVGQVFSGRFQTLATTEALHDEISAIASEAGYEFEREVADAARTNPRFAVRESVDSLNGSKPQRSNGDYLGDFDVLAADMMRRILYAIECKDLAGELTPSEVASDISAHFDGSGDSSASRHHERVTWLGEHRADALAELGVTGDASQWHSVGMFVTGTHVMAPYIRDAEFEILSLDEFREWVSGLASADGSRQPKRGRRKHGRNRRSSKHDPGK